MAAVIRRENPTLCFFLGDGERDLKQVQERFPSLPFYAVRGNCDPRSALSSALTCVVGGVCIFAAHGHLYNVKYEPELDSLAAAARDAGARLVLFGHTHRARLEVRNGITFLNPGSIGHRTRPGYAVVLPDRGRFAVELNTAESIADEPPAHDRVSY